MRRLKIAIINPVLRTPSVTPPFVVGRPKRVTATDLADTNIVELGRAIGDLGHDVTIYAADTFLEHDTIQVNAHLTVRAAPARLQQIFNPALVAFTPSLADSAFLREADVIQSGEFHQLTTYFSSVAAVAAGIPFLVWQETFHHMRTPGRWYEQLFELSAGRFVRAAASRFLLRTTKARKYLESIGAPPAAIGPWIPTGISGDVFHPGPGTLHPEDFGFPKECPLATFVARLDPDKGADIAIQAVSLLRKKGTRVGLLIRGSGPAIESLKSQAIHQGVEDRVRFLERLSRTEMANLYNSSDLFLLPSRNDLLPFSLLEAGACGLPAVATRVGCVDDFVQDGVNGILVAPNSAVAIASGIRRLLGNDRRRETLGDAARQRFLEHFDIRVTASQLAQVYQRAVGGKATDSSAR